MKKAVQALGMGVLGSLLLAGCGSLVGGAIPPQTVDNAAGLNGVEITSEELITEQAIGGGINFTKEFNNTPVEIPLGIKPNDVSLTLSIKQVRRSGNCTPPNTVALQVRALRVELSEVGSAAKATASFGDFTLNLQKANDDTYTVQSMQPADLKVSMDNGLLTFNVVTAGTQPNSAKVTGRLYIASNELRGCRLGLVVDSAKATFSSFR
ncbi:hypothetical protein [Deinococcus hopiensis]|uniref:Lipoprotein n=1 Tax=Deinococcus hopiensis KR-140 TaxID=695939 RepID=A0A1W1UQ65_9DEIO|nr:hypothetical protein [Deinococcus hopiensis]SMB83237.1 hypothetical protein SAMN00790413_04322 [Deinococcus hopiensis KR-140]